MDNLKNQTHDFKESWTQGKAINKSSFDRLMHGKI